MWCQVNENAEFISYYSMYLSFRPIAFVSSLNENHLGRFIYLNAWSVIGGIV